MNLSNSLSVAAPFAVLEPGVDTRKLDPVRDSSLRRILARCEGGATVAPQLPSIFWDAEFFRFDQSSIFNSLSSEQKASLLESCGRAILREAQLIEIAGTTYSSKMSLLAENLQQRELYSFFSADEVRHLRMITSLVGEPDPVFAKNNSFLQYLSQLIQFESRTPLVFLIQVLLEGWGIHHYSLLAQSTSSPYVAQIFKSIVKDEARHHGSGLILFDEADLGVEELRRLESSLVTFLQMVRIGPLGILAELSKVVGGLNQDEIQEFLEQTQFEGKLAADLELIQSLMSKAGAAKLLTYVNNQGLFELPKSTSCAQTISNILSTSEFAVPFLTRFSGGGL